MIRIMTSSSCSQSNIEGTLLTKEQVEEISTRISKIISESLSKQLEKAISLSEKNEDNENQKIEEENQ